jgi:hypothetical protein
MRSLASLVSLFAVAAVSLHAEVEVQVTGDRVSVRAVSAPVSEILDRLATQTGMKLVYDAPPPRQLLTAALEQRTLPEAVLGILEGLGLNYALVMDRAGVRVEQLLILGAAAPAPARPATPAPPVPRRPPPMAAEELEPDEGADEVPETPEGETAEDEESTAATPTTGPAAPVPPEYPSSTFTPKLPMPPALQPAARTPPPKPQPIPTPSNQ